MNDTTARQNKKPPTPAQRMRAETLARLAQSAQPGDGQQAAVLGAGYDQYMAKLHTDLQTLHGIASIERRAEVKRELLPGYAGWVAGALAREVGVQDDVLLTVMVWSIDVGDYGQALDIADHALAHDLKLPDRFGRPLPTLLVGEVAEAALRAHKTGAPVDVESVLRALDLTRDYDIPDNVRALAHKAVGSALLAAGQVDGLDVLIAHPLVTDASQHLTRAFELDDKCGVQKDRQAAAAWLKKHTPPPAAADGAAG